MTVEAYRWAGLTGGGALLSALSLFLLPFMLGNLTVWFRPAAPDRFGLIAALCRLLGGTLTAAFVLSVAGITLDLIGWQCASYDPCISDRPYLSWLSALPIGVRLAVLAMVPLAALGLLWAVSARLTPTFAAVGDMPGDGAADRLGAAGFWNTEPTIAWLRRVHFCLGAATLEAMLLFALAPLASVGVGTVLLGLAVVVLFWCGLLLARPANPHGSPVRRSGRVLLVVTTGLTMLTLAYAVTLPTTDPPRSQLPGFEGITAGLATLQAALLVALTALTVHRLGARRGKRRPALLGLGTPVLAAAAVNTGAAFAATVVYRVADWLDRSAIPSPVRPDSPGAPPLEPPTSYWWATLAALATLLIAAAAGIWSMLLSRTHRRRDAERIVRTDYPHTPLGAIPRLREIREIIARSQTIERLGPMLVAFLLISALGLGAAALDLIGTGPTQLARNLSGQADEPAVVAYLSDMGIYVISLVVVGLWIMGVLAYRSPETRRTIAVLWDLGTFWPRTIHPFAPPSYGRRTVPELGTRLTALARKGPVILSGHSQGSVLAVATLLQLPPYTLDRVALLTHGSPLHRLYAQLCPAYLGNQTLWEIGERIGWRWRNLWRDTDPIAGPVFPDDTNEGGPTTADDVRLCDPRSLTIDPDDTVPPPVEGHQPYHTGEQYALAIRDLIAQLPPHPDTPRK
ncbi:hypothetical protein ACVCAH_32590 [Micromonospora sp. LZ34]